MMKTNKGQMSIVGLLTVVVVLVVFAALMPTVNDTINNVTPSLSGASVTLIQLFPLFVIVAILATVMIYVSVRYSG